MQNANTKTPDPHADFVTDGPVSAPTPAPYEATLNLGEPADAPAETETETDPNPYTELDIETSKAISAHLIEGLKDGSVVAENGEMHPLMVTITLAEYRRLVADHAADSRRLSDYYTIRAELDKAKKDLEQERAENAAHRDQIKTLQEQLVNAAIKGVVGCGK